MTRRSFLGTVGAFGAAALLGLSGCSQISAGGSAVSSSDGSDSSDSSSFFDRHEMREVVSPEGDPRQVGLLDNSHVSPDPSAITETVFSASVNPKEQQQLFLWEQENVPAITTPSYSEHDALDFRPTITSFPVPDGVQVKGAVLLCADGAFMVRVDNADAFPTAKELSQRGYQTFVVDYRVRPYTQAEGGVDLAHAIRFVRAHWQDYNLPDAQSIAVGGYSAGGILCGETLIHWRGNVMPDALDAPYVPDELDKQSADVAADAMIYSFYGRLSVASRDRNLLGSANLPPTYYCYGTEDPFYDQFEMQVDLMDDLGYRIHARVLDSWPHGFGALGGWIPEFDDFMQEAFRLVR